MVKPTTSHIVLCLSLSQKWCIRQLDVTTTFLNDDIQEEVNMTPTNRVCESWIFSPCLQVKKVTYGLKQAYRVWYLKMSECLSMFSFHGSNADFSIMIFDKNGDFIVSLIYIDDIIVKGNNHTLIDALIVKPSSMFSLWWVKCFPQGGSYLYCR